MSSDDLPLSLRLAWWATAWWRGDVSPDDLLDAVHGDDVTHVVLSAEGTPRTDGGGAPEALVPALASARAAGGTGVAAAFVVPGDPRGLGGPRAFTSAAVDAGEAVLLLGGATGWVPSRVGHAVEWARHPADRRPPPDLGEADRGLRSALLVAADRLADLDVAAWRPELADELIVLHDRVEVIAPPGIPDRCRDLAGRALRLDRVLDLALSDDGGALGVAEATARRATLEPLSAAVRHALTAAGSPDGWPPR